MGDIKQVFGKNILVWVEQGFGDSIQFSRYIELLIQNGACVFLQLQDGLEKLMLDSFPKAKLLDENSLRKVDYQISLLSLPRIFSTTLDNIPSHTPYLTVDPQKAGAWKSKLGNKTKARIGLSWFGNSAQKDDAQRSLDLHLLTPLLDLPFEFHSLHKEYRPQDTEILCKTPQIIDHHLDLQDFSDTAALMNEMDLVISVCTSLAHLSGALDKSTILLLHWNSDWRWLIQRRSSPWYRSFRLYRQTFQGDWVDTLDLVAQDLKKTLTS